MRKLVITSVVAILLVLSMTGARGFAAVEKQFNPKENTPLNYVFTIKFSDVVNENKIQSVQILDGEEEIDTEVSYSGNEGFLSSLYDFEPNKNYEIYIVLANGKSFKKAFTTGEDYEEPPVDSSELEDSIQSAKDVLASFPEYAPVAAKASEAKMYIKLNTAIQTAQKALTGNAEQQELAVLTLNDVVYSVEEYMFAMDGLQAIYEEITELSVIFGNWPTTVKSKLSSVTKIQTDMLTFLKNKESADELMELQSTWADALSEGEDALYEAADSYFEKEFAPLATKFETLSNNFYDYDNEKSNYAIVEAAYEKAEAAYDQANSLYFEYDYTAIKAALDALKAANTNLDKYV